jgi:hypothetical protein
LDEIVNFVDILMNAMDPTIKIQSQIRQNAEEVSQYLSDMAKWEKEISKKDKKVSRTTIRNAHVSSTPQVRAGAGTISTNGSNSLNSKKNAVNTKLECNSFSI